MTIISNCWSPCWCHSNVKQGSIAVSIWTIVMSIVAMVYISWVMNGGQSSDIYSPFFEADIDKTMNIAGGITMAYSCLYLISGFLLLAGINTDIRGLLLPFLVLNGIICLTSLAMGIFLIARYYIYPLAMLGTVFMWLYFCIQTYCQMCVTSLYQILVRYQTTKLVVMYP